MPPASVKAITLAGGQCTPYFCAVQSVHSVEGVKRRDERDGARVRSCPLREREMRLDERQKEEERKESERGAGVG